MQLFRLILVKIILILLWKEVLEDTEDFLFIYFFNFEIIKNIKLASSVTDVTKTGAKLKWNGFFNCPLIM